MNRIANAQARPTISIMLVVGFLASGVFASIPEAPKRQIVGGMPESLELPPITAFADEVERWGSVASPRLEEPAKIAGRPFALGLNASQIPTEYRLFARPPPKRIVLPDVGTHVAGFNFGWRLQATGNKRFSLGLALGHSEDPLGDVDMVLVAIGRCVCRGSSFELLSGWPELDPACDLFEVLGADSA